MRREGTLGSVVVCLGVGLAAWAATSRAAEGPADPRAEDPAGPAPALALRYAELPLHFEPNLGQADPQVDFLARAAGYAVLLEATGATIALPRAERSEPPAPQRSLQPDAGGTEIALVRMRFVGADAEAAPSATGVLPGRSHYLVGRDPDGWRTDIRNYTRVRYSEVYPGIDVDYYGTQRRLEYDLVVAPDADPGQVALAFEGVERTRITEAGDLVLEAPGGELTLRAPVVYQEEAGSRKRIEGRYVAGDASRVRFALGPYDATAPLVIDPVLEYSTYLGGSGLESPWGIAVDGAGSAYVAGTTTSLDFPVVGAPSPALRGIQDAFVAKLSPSGTSLVYATYVGGSAIDSGTGIAVDAQGHAYMTGSTNSADFPTTANALQPTYPGGSCGSIRTSGTSLFPCTDAFVVELDPSGSSLVYSTYLGGPGSFNPFLGADSGGCFTRFLSTGPDTDCIGGDAGFGIATDVAGNVYVTGVAGSLSFPTLNAVQATLAGSGGLSRSDAFVAKLDPTGALVYATLLGGTSSDHARGIAADSNGNAHIAGGTNSIDFPVANALQATGNSGDAFVAKLSPPGGLVYSTYLGGSGHNEFALGIAVDAAGNVIVAGRTDSPDWPLLNPRHGFRGGLGGLGPSDAFLTKLNPQGDGFVFSTYLGGNGSDSALGVAVGSADDVYVAGYTQSTDFPVVDAFQPSLRSGLDAFVSKLDPAGFLVYSSYLGGTEHCIPHGGGPLCASDFATGVAVDAAGDAYVTGYTETADFPLVNPLQAGLRGRRDGFVARIGPGADLAIRKDASEHAATLGQPLTYTIEVENLGPKDAVVTVTDPLPSGVTLDSVTASQGSCTGATSVTCALGDLGRGASATIELVVTPTLEGSLTNTAAVEGVPGDPDRSDNEASVTVDVIANQPPVAAGDEATTREDVAVVVAVLDNDSDPDGDVLTLIEVSGAANGTLRMNPDTVGYTPDPDFNGVDAFSYTIGDSLGGQASATVTVTVTPVNDAPSFAAGPSVSVPEDSGAQSLPWASSTSPGPGDESAQALAFDVTATNPGLFAVPPAIDPAGTLSFTPAADAHGAATVTVVLRDDGGTLDGGADSTAPSSFTVTVTPVNDAPALAAPADQGSDEGSSPSLQLTASDVDGDALSFSATGLPPGLAIDGDSGLIGGALDFESAGTYAVAVSVSDGDLSDAVSFTWTVNDVNRAPEAVDDAASAVEGEATTIAVLDNDSDPDGDPLTVSGVTQGLYGNVTTDGARVTYTANVFEALMAAVARTGLNGGQQRSLVSKLEAARSSLSRGNANAAQGQLAAFANAVEAQQRRGGITPAEAAALIGPIQALAGGSLTDTFSYTVDDGKGGTDTAVVTVTVG